MGIDKRQPMYSLKCNAGLFFASDRGAPFLLLLPFSALYPYDFVFNSDKLATSRLFRFVLCSECTNAREKSKEKGERFVSYRFNEIVDLSGYVRWDDKFTETKGLDANRFFIRTRANEETRSERTRRYIRETVLPRCTCIVTTHIRLFLS